MTEKLPDGVGDLSLMKDSVDADGGSGPSTTRSTDADSLREMQLSIAASSSVFPGFRFSPTDDELISYYLKKKLQGADNCVDIIPEVDFCRHEPWDLPALSIIRSDNEWFFFSARGKKYPNGSQSKRATQSGYWKATGKERNVKSGAVTIGTKRTLVFHSGRAPKGERTEWIMHEYCMNDCAQESLVVCRLRKNSDFKLNESPRGSIGPRNFSVSHTSHSDAKEYADNALADGFDDSNAIKSNSKGSASSYRSHSFEQNDSGSESDQKATHESPHGSSSPHKDRDNEYDCFADIINDDIIQLDESASHSLKFHGFLPKDLPTLVQDPTKCMPILTQETMSARPFSGQGTAVRRIKLRRQKCRTHEPPPAQNQPNRLEKQSSGCFVSIMTGKANKLAGSRTTHVVLVLLFLVVMFAGWEGYQLTSCFKEKLGVSGLEVWKGQLKCWLSKAADYI
ncbi:hypothetical protein L1887_32478 [Cichorium endivia]|nr:hypothetical protein L1887_32478 [Cichorium endivia]